MTAPARREVVREIVTRGLSERRALTVVHMSAAALRYVPRPDPDPGLGARIVALAHRHRLELRGVAATRGLAHAKGLEPQFTGGNLRQVAAFLFGGSVPKQRTHDVHLRVAGRGVAAAPVDLLENDGRVG